MDKVMFRKFGNGEVIALFPEMPFDLNGNITSYMHVGQHGAASIDLCNSLSPASEDEYHDLYDELVQIGYDLELCNS